ncbi:glycosyltransferase family 2 protein [Thermoanaerobacterium butyriciformans]|uniref:Glucosyl-3-phosphoglycerate synthase n=1 Tax=Thermoanaerobacterium butyriciformans TaxID=1702242 RepID=A0ABS4NHM8_9THEO|nr:glycosyltransferase family 2 protein [Thermoanaerobacterium butyriciformans]MBP2073172.1 glycosyltransferase involved in cell wall biosynthesis [Thermoanaerobacterium butyriciformans]
MISVIIPAYNEEKNIKNVLYVLKKINIIDEIIVVNDGSTDDTEKVVSLFEVKLINLRTNLGKGAAVKRGIQAANGDFLVLLDADLIGFTPEHFNKLVKPVLENNCDMTVGVFSSGRKRTDLAQKIAPFLSGQRALKKDLFIEFINDKDIDILKYGIEVALTKYAKEKHLRVQHVQLENMTHIMKEEKLGFIKGFKARLRMYKDILKVWM